jgi:hypothetical protein
MHDILDLTTVSDLLKIDIDGDEFPVLDRFMDDAEGHTLPIGQLLIEIHLYEKTAMTFSKFRTWWEKLETLGMREVSQEANFRQAVIGDPKAVEVRQSYLVKSVAHVDLCYRLRGSTRSGYQIDESRRNGRISILALHIHQSHSLVALTNLHTLLSRARMITCL